MVKARIVSVLFELVRFSIRDACFLDKDTAAFPESLLPELFALSQKHDMAHLVGYALEKKSLLVKENPCSEKFSQEKLKAVYRYVKLNHELMNLCETLESAQIPFIPLKGSVIRKYYPEPWMRTSCDIDVLVHEEDVEKAVRVLVDNKGYIFVEKGSHDVSLFSANGIHIELHYKLVEDKIANKSADVLNDIWKAIIRHEGYQYWHELTDEMFYFYHIAHMAKHFENGGCGIRPFIDLWILDNLEGINQNKRDELLERGDLLKFAETARKLSMVWLDGAEMDVVSQQMENYILRGGVYGNNENRVMVQQQKKGGRLKYALSKIFIPYEVIKFHYPILQKHCWLTPIMEVRRWFKLAFCGHAKRVTKELKFNQSVSSEVAAETEHFLKNIGL